MALFFLCFTVSWSSSLGEEIPIQAFCLFQVNLGITRAKNIPCKNMGSFEKSLGGCLYFSQKAHNGLLFS